MLFGRCSLLAASLFALLHVPLSADTVRVGSRSFRIPDGFELTLVAPPPLVLRPICVDFDEEGRLYVADSAGVNDKVVKQLEDRPHRILRIEDRDGDGVFDASHVFADRMMFPEGTLWHDGSLYVAAPPSIWKLTDTDGDGVSDRREEWLSQTLTGCANDLHGPYLGRDGWIYWCKGAFAKQEYARANGAPFVTRAAHIFRRRPEGGEIEPVMTGGMDNPVEVVFTPAGERIFSTTFFQHPGGGKRDGLVHAIYGGVYGKRHGVIDEHPRTGDVMPVLSHLGPAAPCGLAFYESTGLGEDYRGNLFTCLFNLHKVTRHELAPNGASFTSRDSDLISSTDVDFHPTDVIEDADGSLLVVDTGGWYKICCPTSQLFKPDVLGAIYRLRRKGAAVVDDARGLTIDWDRATNDALVERLEDVRPRVRSRAIETLGRRGSEAVPALGRVLSRPSSAEAKRNAVWTLARIEGEAARGAVRRALADEEASVRQVAAHVSGLVRDGEASPSLVRLLADAPAVSRSAAEALGRIGDSAAVAPLLRAAGRTTDRILAHSLAFALIEIDDATATRRGLASESAGARVATLIAVDQMRSGGWDPRVVCELLDANDKTVRETAEWIVGRRPEWGGDVAKAIERALLAPDATDESFAALRRVAAGLLASTDIQSTLAKLVESEIRVEWRRSLLALFASSGFKDAPAVWARALGQVLKREPALEAEAVAAARRLPNAAKADPSLRGGLLAIASDNDRPKGARLRSLAAASVEALDGRFFSLALEGLGASARDERSSATDALATAELTAPQTRRAIAALETVGPLEITSVVEAVGHVDNEELGASVVTSLSRAPAKTALRRESFSKWLEGRPATVRAAGARFLATLDVDADARRTRLDELLSALPDGDVRRGQAVFRSEKTACAACHAIGYLGGKIGPDLTRIGTIRSERDLLESLVFPSASIARSYESIDALTTGGETFTGIVRSESARELHLITGADTEVRIPAGEVAEIAPSAVSLMPSGLADQLTPAELADLLAFLRATRW